MSAQSMRRSKITITRPGEQTGTDGFGHPTFGPPVSFDLPAHRQDQGDGERMAAGALGSFVRAWFQVRSSVQTRGIKPAWTLTHDGEDWNIEGVKEAKESRRRMLEITAVRSLD